MQRKGVEFYIIHGLEDLSHRFTLILWIQRTVVVMAICNKQLNITESHLVLMNILFNFNASFCALFFEFVSQRKYFKLNV